jgi:hypothetical protein
MQTLKHLWKFLLYLCSIILVMIVFLSVPYVHNFVIKKIIESFVESDNIKLDDINVRLSLNQIILSDLKINSDNQIIEIDQLKLNYNIKDLIKTRKTSFSILSNGFYVNSDSLLLDLKIDGNFNARKGKIISLLSIKSNYVDNNKPEIKNISFNSNIIFSDNILKFSKSNLSINDGYFKFDLDAKFKNDMLEDLKISSEINNIPFKIYDLILSPEHGVHKFITESIEKADIIYGKFDIHFDQDLLSSIRHNRYENIDKYINSEKVSGFINCENVSYIYDLDMPKITSKNLTIKLGGRVVAVDLKHAEVAGSKVTEGYLALDYLGEKIDLLIKAKASGRVSGLIDFMGKDQVAKLQNSEIDLKKSDGIVSSDIEIKIPLHEEKNIFNVKADINSFNLKCLKDSLNLTKYKLTGLFSGDKLTIKGMGLVNGMDSSTDFIVNIDDKSEFSHKLTSEIKLKKSEENLPGIKVLDGISNLSVSLISKQEDTSIKIYSNLKNLHFQIPMISLDKPAKQRAFLNVEGYLNSGKNQNLNISLKGEDNLNISGEVKSTANDLSLDFKKVSYLNSDFSAFINFKEKSLDAKIKGKLLDLSAFKPESSDDSSTFNKFKVKLELDKIKLKNNIDLTNALAYIDCRAGICPVARFNSSINGTDYLIVEYLDKEKPKWYLETNEAGKLISALGITSKVKRGNMKAEIFAPLSKAKDPNYSTTGNITIWDFDMSENIFLTRLVSFISVPGLLGALSNSDIRFDGAKVNFTLKDKIALINDMSCEGPYFNFFTKGKIDFKKNSLNLRGQVYPSLYGMNKLVGSLPVLKYIFGKRGGVIFTPFFYDYKF